MATLMALIVLCVMMSFCTTLADICALPDTTRVECGFPGITIAQCHARGCCFAEPGGDHQCSKNPLPCISRNETCSNHGDCVPADTKTKTPPTCKCDRGFTGSRCDRPSHSGPTYPDVDVVHVINSCHLDIGFARSSADIINLYFDHHFPTAIAVGKSLRTTQGSFANKRLNFMFQSWVVSMYLDCPPNMGLHCPSASAVAAFEDAVAAGDITWHAFPHNAELAVMDPSLIEAGLALTWALDDRFKVPRKHTLSQRDVPGMTRALIPLLKGAGVRAISIGANDGSTPPDVPPAFLWKDIATETEIVGFLNWPGYGHWNPKGQQVIEPVEERSFDPSAGLQHFGHGDTPMIFGREVDGAGASHALVYNFNGDNAGPRRASDYVSVVQSIQKVFPNAKVMASSFDDFTAAVADEVKAGRQFLPVVTSELADTWIYGVPSDPQKVARARVLNRAWAGAKERHLSTNHLSTNHLSTNHLSTNRTSTKQMPIKSPSAQSSSWVEAVMADKVFLNATRFALKFGEHTWGKDVKSNLFDNYDWLNKDFHKAKSAGSKNASQYNILEESWWEQRHWGITLAVTTLADATPPHPMAAPLMEAMAALKPTVPSLPTPAWKEGKAGQSFTCGRTTLAFGEDGSIAQLTTMGSEWASQERTLLAPVYQSYSAADVDAFFATYCKSNAGWVQHDYGKPGLRECCSDSVVGQLWPARVQELWFAPSSASPGTRGAGTPSCRFALKQGYDSNVHEDYGAPGSVWSTIDVVDGTSADSPTRLQVVMGMFNKTQTRLPEAMFVRFNPVVTANASYEVNKLGSWIDTKDVVSGGSKHLHGVVSKGPVLRVGDAGRTMTVESFDAAVVNLGKLTAYPSPVNVTADTATYGSAFVLWDNLWGTNYVMWWPFEQPPPASYARSQQFFPSAWNADMVSRFNLTFSS